MSFKLRVRQYIRIQINHLCSFTKQRLYFISSIIFLTIVIYIRFYLEIQAVSSSPQFMPFMCGVTRSVRLKDIRLRTCAL